MVKIEVKNDTNKLNKYSVSPNSIIISAVKDEKVRAALQKLDHDHDDDIDAHEVLRLKKIEVFYRKASYFLLLVSLVLIGVIFAASYGAVELGKEFHTEKDASSDAVIETRRRLNDGTYQDQSSTHLNEYPTQSLFDLNGHSLGMSGFNDMSVPTGAGASLLKYLVQPYIRRSEDRRRRRERMRRALYEESGIDYENIEEYDYCTAHSDCTDFCNVDGVCDVCAECHYCYDGIDNTCGTCEPTVGSGDCVADDYYHHNTMGDMPHNLNPMDDPLESEAKENLDLDDVYAVTCDYPYQALAFACPHLRWAPHYTLTTPLDSLHRKIIPMEEEMVISYEGDMCGHFAWMDVVVNMMQDTEDKLELNFPTKYGFKTVDMTGRCWYEVHMKSPESIAELKEYENHREENFEEFEDYYYEIHGENPLPPGEMPPYYIYHDDTMFDHYADLNSEYIMPWGDDYEHPFYDYHYDYYINNHPYDYQDHGDYHDNHDYQDYNHHSNDYHQEEYSHHNDYHHDDSTETTTISESNDSYYHSSSDNHYVPEENSHNSNDFHHSNGPGSQPLSSNDAYSDESDNQENHLVSNDVSFINEADDMNYHSSQDNYYVSEENVFENSHSYDFYHSDSPAFSGHEAYPDESDNQENHPVSNDVSSYIHESDENLLDSPSDNAHHIFSEESEQENDDNIEQTENSQIDNNSHANDNNNNSENSYGGNGSL